MNSLWQPQRRDISRKSTKSTKLVLLEGTNNSQGSECVVECWKTHKGEDLGDGKALELVTGEKNGKNGIFWHQSGEAR